MNNQLLHQIALTIVSGVGYKLGRELISKFGDAETVFKTNPASLEMVNGIGYNIARKIHQTDVFTRAEKELAFIEKNKIRCSFISDKDYPEELKHCDDAPLMLYMKGNMDFAGKRMVSIVGTRKMSSYGQALTEKFIHDLAQQFSDLIIVSGLAYGVDIHAHKCALKEKIPTVAVLAHGLDRIYPSAHRNVAVEMLQTGGVLTEYISETNPDRPNFLVRNRIIAGLSQATVVIESGYKGGSLNTAVNARDYGKSVFAFPGRVTDANSQGCHRLVTNDTARLISDANDFILAMLWDVEATPKAKQPEQQPAISTHLAEKYGLILEIFQTQEEINVDEASAKYNIPFHVFQTSLMELEMIGVVQSLPNDTYKLI